MKERRLLFLESHATQSVWQGAYDFVIPERTARLTGSSLVMNRIFNVQSLRQFSLLSTLCMYMSRIKVAPYSVIAACCEKIKGIVTLERIVRVVRNLVAVEPMPPTNTGCFADYCLPERPANNNRKKLLLASPYQSVGFI